MICSDDTGNTRVAREIVHKKYPWIFTVADPCHRRMSYLQPIMVTKHVIKFMSNSTHAKTMFRQLMPQFQVTRGLVKPGKTRFAGVVHAMESVRRCMPVLEELTFKDLIKIPVS